MDGHNHLFIAGASRSGTTLLMNLLDGHPEILVFPLEHKVFKHYFTKPEAERQDYFLDAFIKERSEGQQSVLASSLLYERYRARIGREFGTDFTLDLDNEAFLRCYQQHLREGPFTLERIFEALTAGLVAANDHAASIHPRLKVAVFKDPFTTEFFARRTAERMPEARFLHIIRDPYARYCSIKGRLLRNGGMTRRKFIRRINHRDFVTGLAEQAIASLHCALQNQRALGTNYLIIRFEDLVQSPRETLSEIIEWLGVDFDPTLLRPSKLGEPAASGSSFNPTKKIDARTTDRRETHFFEMTSASERDVYHRCLALSDYPQFYDTIEPHAEGQRVLTWIQPFKGERVRDYLWRLATGKAWLGQDARAVSDSLRTRLPGLYANGKQT